MSLRPACAWTATLYRTLNVRCGTQTLLKMQRRKILHLRPPKSRRIHVARHPRKSNLGRDAGKVPEAGHQRYGAGHGPKLSVGGAHGKDSQTSICKREQWWARHTTPRHRNLPTSRLIVFPSCYNTRQVLCMAVAGASISLSEANCCYECCEMDVLPGNPKNGLHILVHGSQLLPCNPCRRFKTYDPLQDTATLP